MKLHLEFFIDGNRVDLFEDETIQITSKIKDAKEVGKVFSNSTHEFNLPSSKINDEIFKHYYKYEILDNSFDARYKVDALIKISGVDYRVGKVRLTNVKLKNGKASSYKVTFFGNTIKLSDLLGDDKLSQLPLSKYNHQYSPQNVKDAFETGLTYNEITEQMEVGIERDIIYSFISADSRYFYDSLDSQPEDERLKNCSYDATTSELDRGILYLDLKPSLRLIHIIEAIEERYNITFSRNFFDTIAFKELYLWLHNNEGYIKSNNISEYSLCDWKYDIGSTIPPMIDWLTTMMSDNPNNCTFNPSKYSGGVLNFYFSVTATPTDGSITLRVIDKNNDNQVLAEIEGSDTVELEFGFDSSTDREVDLLFQIISEDVTTFDPRLKVTRGEGPSVGFSDYNLSSIPLSPISTLNISNTIPDMKVIDFLSSIFKMFNLTTYHNENKLTYDPIEEGGLYVQPLQDFYNLGRTIDITRYVDTNETTVERLLPYSQIEYRYEKPVTFLTLAHNSVFASEFGNLLWNESGSIKNFDGKKYVVQSNFEHMVFEKLTDLSFARPLNIIDIQYGYFVDDKEEPALGAPLVYYNEITDNSLNPLKFATLTDKVEQYNRPSNTLTIEGTTIVTINFGIEKDEFRPMEEVKTNSLFNLYHTDYIRRLFSAQARKITYDAVLPPHILLDINLNDTLVIGNRYFMIEEMKTNLMTGKSNLVLTNEVTLPLPTPLPNGVGSLNAAVTSVNNGYTIINLTWLPGDYSGDPMTFYVDGDSSSHTNPNNGSWLIAIISGVPPMEREIQITDGSTNSTIITLTV